VHWGVDSWGPADGPGDGPNGTLLEHVARRMGRVPAFWGRYLNRRLPQDRRTGEVRSPEHNHAITPREIDFLHAHDCRVLLVYNGHTGREDRLRGGLHAGREAAELADALAGQLVVPPHVAIYADVENWAGDVGWFRGWYETMHARGRRCGVYGRPIRVVENPADPSPTYGTPLARIESRHTRELAARRIDEETRWTGHAPRRVMTHEYWSDELAHALADVRVESVIERGVDPFSGSAADPFYIWSSEPRRVSSATADASLDGADIPTEFLPAEPPHAAGARTVVWQYLENAIHRGGAHGAVDMNLCNDAGYGTMW
jgi:hypothetical protein